MSENANYVWDFTLSAEFAESFTDVIETFKGRVKRWGFQKEESDGGYIHWQGRISLIKPKRLPHLVVKIFKDTCLEKASFSITSTENKDNFDYAEKIDTRIEGPWNYQNYEIVYIPRQFRGLLEKLFPFQLFIKDDCLYNFNDRICNLVICKTGGNGKSTIASLMELHYKCIDLPPCNDFKEVVQACCDICYYTENRDPKGVFFDLPRAMTKDQLRGIFMAMEQIKKGKLFDFRYKYKTYWIDSPSVWMFTNYCPDLKMLSMDRWRLWEVDDETKELKPYEPEKDKTNGIPPPEEEECSTTKLKAKLARKKVVSKAEASSCNTETTLQ